MRPAPSWSVFERLVDGGRRALGRVGHVESDRLAPAQCGVESLTRSHRTLAYNRISTAILPSCRRRASSTTNRSLMAAHKLELRPRTPSGGFTWEAEKGLSGTGN